MVKPTTSRQLPPKTLRKAASDVAIHPTPHFPEFDHREKPHHIDYVVDIIHHKKEPIREEPTTSATNTVASEMTELYQLREALKKSWKQEIPPGPEMNHLKREPFHFREYIPYNVEFPHRVAVQIQRLLGTGKVHLNDPAFVTKIQDKVAQAEDAEMEKKIHHRAKSEFDRVKRLIIDGTVDGTTLPPDLQALKAHPAYIVKQMLDRLNTYDNDKTPAFEKPKVKINLVEPFEHNGAKFFKHLHKTGDMNWTPKRIKRERRRELKKKENLENLPPSKTKTEQPHKLRLLYKRQLSIEETPESVTDMPGIIRQQETTTLESREVGSTTTSAATKYDFPNENILKQFLQEQIMADALDQKNRIEERRKEQLDKEKLAEEQWKVATKERQLSVKKEVQADVGSRSSPTVDVNTSFERLRKSFGIREIVDTYQFKMPANERILKFIDEAEDANELFGNSAALNRLYTREAKFVEKFLPILQRKMAFENN